MKREPAPTPISRAEQIGVLLVPWTFIALFCALYVELLLPRVGEGHPIAAIVGVFTTFVLVVFVVAAITFSRDVVTGRWP